MTQQGIFQNQHHFVLASASPRRRDLLATLGVEFDVQPAHVEEIWRQGETPEAFVRRLAKDKGDAVAGDHPHSWILAADTVVVQEQAILGKPADAAEALAMLVRLSGTWHEVWTGYSLSCQAANRHIIKVIRTRVLFDSFSEHVLKNYIRTGEPLDKAGAYGIQGIGAFLVKEIVGSYSNVVGLPVAEVLQDMLTEGILCCS